jgi:hypothetical protein
MASDVSIERTPNGRRLVVARDVPAPREAGWELLTDTERWPDWGPSVRAVECEHRHIRSGTTGRVRLPGGLWLPFEVTTCGEYRWTWRVARIPATGHRVDAPAGVERGCRVAFEVPLLAAGYAPVCLRALDRIASLLDPDSGPTGIPVR